jgi:hypothetical protein
VNAVHHGYTLYFCAAFILYKPSYCPLNSCLFHNPKSIASKLEAFTMSEHGYHRLLSVRPAHNGASTMRPAESRRGGESLNLTGGLTKT